jgi:plastocyanin
MRKVFALVAVLAATPVFAQETGTLKAKFVYGGAAFKPDSVKVDKDVEFCGKHPLVNEQLLVDAASQGIQNVVLYVFTGRGGSKLPPQAPTNATHELANDKCRFEPRIVVLQAGDSLKITNPDAVGHNANLNFFVNPAQNITIPPGAEKVVKVQKAEPAPIPVDCNIHPWMRAYVISLDHPFVSVSNNDGEIEIKGLPAGEKLVFRLYHEAAAGAINEVMINGKATALKKNLLELDIKAGMNDLGTITIPANAFSVK